MMCRELLHIYGPFSIYSYGVALALGILIYVWLCLRDPQRKKIISQDKFIQVVCLSLIIGLVGARLLFIFTSWNTIEHDFDLLNLFNGGLSLLGGIGAIVICMPWYLKRNNIQVLPLLDIAALYAPVLHAIARIGCFMAGCCYGLPTSLPWAITYTDSASDAPLWIALHPTQLYSSAAFVSVFIFLLYARKYLKKSGQMLVTYLMCESVVRFTMEFFRADTEYYSFLPRYFTAYQWISLMMFSVSALGFVVLTLCPTQTTLHNK